MSKIPEWLIGIDLYKIPEWITKFGAPRFNDEEVVAQRCRRDIIRGNKVELPEPWKCEKIGWQWFIYLPKPWKCKKVKGDWFFYEDEQELSGKPNPIDNNDLLEDFEKAGINEHIQNDLLAAAKESVATGRHVRVLIEFNPQGFIGQADWDKAIVKRGKRTRSAVRNHVDLKRVKRVYEKVGDEFCEITVGLGDYKEPPDRYDTPDYWYERLHRKWLMIEVLDQKPLELKGLTAKQPPYRGDARRSPEMEKTVEIISNSETAENFKLEQKKLKELADEAASRLWHHCIWCGKRLPLGMKHGARYCDRSCNDKFLTWQKRVRKIARPEDRLHEVDKRMTEIQVFLVKA